MTGLSIWLKSVWNRTKSFPRGEPLKPVSFRGSRTAHSVDMPSIERPPEAVPEKFTTIAAWGSDGWRYQGKARCDAKPIRLDFLEATVWREIERLIEDPSLIQSELERRLEVARTSDPVKKNKERIVAELSRIEGRMGRLTTAYEEELLTLDELRGRLPELRSRESRLKAELESITSQLADQATYLKLAHTMEDFLARIKDRAESLDVSARQKVVRLLVKEVIVGRDKITIRHSIPSHQGPTEEPGGKGSFLGKNTNIPSPPQSYLLCTGRDHSALRGPLHCCRTASILYGSGFQPLLDEPDDAFIADSVLQKPDHPVMIDLIKESDNVSIQNPIYLAAFDSIRKRI